jgi:hypothetical protein
MRLGDHLRILEASVRAGVQFREVRVVLMSNSIVRGFIISRLLQEDGSLKREKLEALNDENLVNLAKTTVSELSFLTLDLMKLDDSQFETHSPIRSSAPYSSGSSDKAMLSGR